MLWKLRAIWHTPIPNHIIYNVTGPPEILYVFLLSTIFVELPAVKLQSSWFSWTFELKWGFDTAKQSKWTQHEVFIGETAFQPIVWGNWVGKFFIDVVKTTSLITGRGSGEEMSGCTLEHLKSRFSASSLNSTWPREEGLPRTTHQLQRVGDRAALNTSGQNGFSSATQNNNHIHSEWSSCYKAPNAYQGPDPLPTFPHSVFTKTGWDWGYCLYFVDEKNWEQGDWAICPRSHSWRWAFLCLSFLICKTKILA